MKYKRISVQCFCSRLIDRLARYCVYFSGTGDLQLLRRVVCRVRDLGLTPRLAYWVLTCQLSRIQALFCRLTDGLTVRVCRVNNRTVRVRFRRNGTVVATLRIRVVICKQRSKR